MQGRREVQEPLVEEAPLQYHHRQRWQTDLPIRRCVYLPCGARDDLEKPGVLPGLYCWGQEANRIGYLINRKSPEGEGELKKVLIRDRRQV
ncbi:hypothetical protein J3459_009894 [Metarhizium acridum]|nr:hypothetical protein J3459_009894 [Metarhizium acridum]